MKNAKWSKPLLNSPLVNVRKQQRDSIYSETRLITLLLTEWYFQEEMKLNEAIRQKRTRELTQTLLGGEDGWGLLQARIEHDMDGILSRLKKDFPRMSTRDILIFSYTMAGLSNSLICHLTGLSCNNAVSVVKSRMRFQIKSSRSPYKFEYLAMLTPKRLPILQRIAIFA